MDSSGCRSFLGLVRFALGSERVTQELIQHSLLHYPQINPELVDPNLSVPMHLKMHGISQTLCCAGTCVVLILTCDRCWLYDMVSSGLVLFIVSGIDETERSRYKEDRFTTRPSCSIWKESSSTVSVNMEISLRWQKK